jgi:hypothetical protein
MTKSLAALAQRYATQPARAGATGPVARTSRAARTEWQPNNRPAKIYDLNYISKYASLASKQVQINNNTHFQPHYLPLNKNIIALISENKNSL